MVERLMSVALAALFSLVTLTSLAAQDDPAAPDDGAAVRPFAEVFAEWKANDQGLNALIEQYRTTPVAERAELVKQYEKLIEKSRALLPLLRSSAITAYEAAPNADKNVVDTLVGLLANDVRTDRYSSALELGKFLLKHKCDEPALHSFLGAAAYCADDFATAELHLQKAKELNSLTSSSAAYLDDLETAKAAWARELKLREAEAAADDLPRVKLQTSKGDIVLELLENEAPQAVGNFISLVEKEFYNGLTFHRVLPGFMAQGGCPEGTGTGGPGYKIRCECEQENHREHFRGALSMAHAGKDTGGSQFFLTFRRTAHLDGRHTVFGRVIEGMEILEKLQRRDPSGRGQPDPDKIVKAEVLRKRDHPYAPTKVE